MAPFFSGHGVDVIVQCSSVICVTDDYRFADCMVDQMLNSFL